MKKTIKHIFAFILVISLLFSTNIFAFADEAASESAIEECTLSQEPGNKDAIEDEDVVVAEADTVIDELDIESDIETDKEDSEIEGVPAPLESSEEVLAAGTCGENVTWELTVEGEMIIEGYGEMDETEVPWSGYLDYIKTLTIADGVTSIGSSMFQGCKNLETISIPNTIEVISPRAFDQCPLIEEIYYGGSKSEWDKIEIGDNNNGLDNAEIHYAVQILAEDMVSLSKTSYVYNGTAIEPVVTVVCNGISLNKGTDYTVKYSSNTHAGTGKVIVKGQGTFAGTVTKTFKITKVKLASATLKNNSYVYNGKERTQTQSIVVKAKVNGSTRTLVSGKDYSVSYNNNKNVGTATAIIKGKGNYKGTIKKTFTILPKATTISSLKKGVRQFTLKWKKQSAQTSGYQIQYSTNQSFSSKKTITVKSTNQVQKTIKNIKATKYYVRIRTYKTSGGKDYYSTWSKVKQVEPSAWYQIKLFETWEGQPAEYTMPIHSETKECYWHSITNYYNQQLPKGINNINYYYREIEQEKNIFRFGTAIEYYGLKEDFELPYMTAVGGIFLGWYKDKALTKRVTKINNNTDKDMTLYAKWQTINREFTNQEADQILSEVAKVSFKKGVSEKTKLTIIGNMVISYLYTYDLSATSYTKLMSSAGNCWAYCDLTQRLCNLAGLECQRVRVEGANHEYCVVRADGANYKVDQGRVSPL